MSVGSGSIRRTFEKTEATCSGLFHLICLNRFTSHFAAKLQDLVLRLYLTIYLSISKILVDRELSKDSVTEKISATAAINTH